MVLKVSCAPTCKHILHKIDHKNNLIGDGLFRCLSPHLVRPFLKTGLSQIRLLRALFSCVVGISKDGHSRVSLGNLLQHLPPSL